ncbi:g8606 [Coccomyxa viridis]|uniref:G8606 protein n=1 Tax=Coccomyxa viridis TaxID=1274662 RepID=A0ABP1G3D3_9CHLO
MKDSREVQLQRELADCVMSSSWIFCLSGVALSIPFGIRSKSYLPLVYLGVGGTVLDMVNGYWKCNKQRNALKAYQDTMKGGRCLPAPVRPLQPAKEDKGMRERHCVQLLEVNH